MMIYYLVGGMPTPLKNMSSSVGMIIPNIWEIKAMFQTTNQITIIRKCYIMILYWSVVSTLLKNISQMGLSLPTEWKNKIHVSNHQPGKDWFLPKYILVDPTMVDMISIG